MSPSAQLQAFGQSIYLVIKNRYFDGITGDDGQVYLSQVIDWTNQFLDELEGEQDANGNPINWSWARQVGVTLGTAVLGAKSVDFDSSTYLNLVADEKRLVQIAVNGQVVSGWKVVPISELPNRTDRVAENLCARVGDTLYFSRAFSGQEAGGAVTGDVTTPLPRLSTSNVKILSTVKPKQLLVLGVAKNATLPDKVQGKLSPNYAQKFNDLLTNAIAREAASSQADTAERDDLSAVSGIGF